MRNKGAKPPAGTEWYVGKSHQTIAFVHQAEKYLLSATDPAETQLLQNKIANLKSGDESLQEQLTVEDFLKSA